MIGTIIIAVVGYGSALLLFSVGITALYRIGADKTERVGANLAVAAACATMTISVAAITRFLTGGW